jgi:hypothetical protein
MTIDTLADLETLHATFVRTIAKQIAEANVERPREPKLILAQRAQLLEQMRQQLADTTAARDLALREYDKDIRAQERTITDLEDQIRQGQTIGRRRKPAKPLATKRRKPK